MSNEPELSMEDFMGLPEAPPSQRGSTDHPEASVARHLLKFAESNGFKPFKIMDWINKAKADKAFDEIIANEVIKEITDVKSAVSRYVSLDLIDSYSKTDPKTGESATKYYIKSPVVTALRNITRGKETQVYFQRRGDICIIIPVAKLAVGTSNKAKAFTKSLELNRKFMYETKDRAALF